MLLLELAKKNLITAADIPSLASDFERLVGRVLEHCNVIRVRDHDRMILISHNTRRGYEYAHALA